MPIKSYGVLKGRAIGRLRDADDDHYQILVTDGSTQHRIAVNVKSQAKNAPSTLLFASIDALPAALASKLTKLPKGFQKVPSKAGGLAQDYVRGQVFDVTTMQEVPPDKPGAQNDLKDLLEEAVRKATDDTKAFIYAFGAKWGPEKKKDQYFHFKPGNGIHDIHMNQGNSGQYKKDNGVWQDGCLFFSFAGNEWTGFLLRFQSQTLPTDAKGNPVGAVPAAKPRKIAKKTPRKAAKKAG